MKSKTLMENTNESDMKILRPDQVADLLGVETSTVWSWLRADILPHMKINGKYYLRYDALRKWMEDQQEGGMG